MPPEITIPWHIQRAYIQAHREYIFLYSTNTFFMSYYGQAAHAAGEPNSFGIPVRHRHCRSDNASYYNDEQFDSLTKSIIDKAFNAIPTDGRPVIALHGIGKGQSELNKRAPSTFLYVHYRILAIQYPNIKWNYYAQ